MKGAALIGVPATLINILGEVAGERARQEELFGDQGDVPDGIGDDPYRSFWRLKGQALEQAARMSLHQCGKHWAAILAEEVGEALNARDVVGLRSELLQVAAVAVAWIEAIDRRAIKP